MMLRFPFGRGSLKLDIPRANLVSVVEPRFMEAAWDEEEVRRAVDHPIGSVRVKDAIKKPAKAVIIVSDITRPAPNPLMVPPVLEALREAGLKTESIEILVASGLHRPASREELEELLGKDVVREVKVVNHNAEDEEQMSKIGKTTFGTDVTLNKMVGEADFVIATGLIEPHFFAGYSGGRKSILPGVASRKSVFQNHSFQMIGHPKARYGILKGNPIHEDAMEAAKMIRRNFMLNVVLNKERKVVKAFAGDFVKAYEAGVGFLEGMVRVSTPRKADIVITTNGGYPLDRNLYQAVKGMATGELVVRRGGVIVILAECIDCIEHESFYQIMEEAKNPTEVLEIIKKEKPVIDQWEAQVLARILKKAQVIVVSKGVKDELIEDMLMTPASTPEEALALALRKVGNAAKIVAIPEGPFVIPQVTA